MVTTKANRRSILFRYNKLLHEYMYLDAPLYKKVMPFTYSDKFIAELMKEKGFLKTGNLPQKKVLSWIRLDVDSSNAQRVDLQELKEMWLSSDTNLRLGLYEAVYRKQKVLVWVFYKWINKTNAELFYARIYSSYVDPITVCNDMDLIYIQYGANGKYNKSTTKGKAWSLTKRKSTLPEEIEVFIPRFCRE